MAIRDSILKACTVVAALLLAVDASAAGTLDRYIQLRKMERSVPGESQQDRGRRLQSAYDAFFGPEQQRVQQRSDADLHLLLGAATLVSFYTDSATPVRDAEADLEELMRRGSAQDRDFLDVYRELVKHRMFSQAALMFKEHHVAGMEPLPNVIDGVVSSSSGQPTEYQVQSDKYELVRRVATVPRTGILVIASPGCHFTIAAVRAIHGDPMLRAIFRLHSKWLAPAVEYFNVRMFQTWDRRYPEARMSIAYRNSDWKVVNDWATPTFYFFRSGRLLKVLRGWPPEGGVQSFEDGLRLEGLIASNVSVRLNQDSISRATPAVTSLSAGKQRAYAQHSPDQLAIDIGTAPIKSHDDLEAYLQRTPMSGSPMRFLSPTDRQLFISGLVFDKNGLAGFRTADLEGISATQAYEILELFGWQTVVPEIEGLRVESSLDKLIMSQSSNEP